MNKEYIQTGDMYVVSTDEGLKKKKRLNNTTEILETENNIEEMEDIKNEIKNKRLFYYKPIFESLFTKNMLKTNLITIPIIIALISIMTLNSATLFFIIVASIFLDIAITTGISLFSSIYKSEKIHDSMHEKANNQLEKEIEKEKEKLNELNKESVVLSKNDLGIFNETILINKTKLIEDLKLKLELIGDYELNKKKYIKYYENSTLYEKLSSDGYSKDSILLIVELIKNDIIEKTNEKVLKLEKK